MIIFLSHPNGLEVSCGIKNGVRSWSKKTEGGYVAAKKQ